MAIISANPQIFRYTLILVFFTLLGIQGFSQYSTSNNKAIKFFEEALYHYNSNQLNAATESAKRALEKDESFIEALSLLGDIEARQKNFTQAKKYYQQIVSIDENAYPKGYYYLATISQQEGAYQEALDYANAFLGFDRIHPKMKERAIKIRDNVAFALKATQNPVPFNPINVGKGVNSPEDEFHPSLSLDKQRLIFTRNEVVAKSVEGKEVKREDFYESTYVDGKWSAAKNMGPPLNTPDNEGAQALSHDGKWLFFTACDRQDGVGKCDIYLAEKRGNNWSQAVNLGRPINSGYWEAQPSFSPDGKTLYFVSNRPQGKGGSDIWSIELQDDGSWGNIKNLAVNTNGNEFSPFMHADGKTLYFSSNGLTGMGGHDLFVARMQADGSFAEVENLGYPINTEKDEHGLIVERGGSYAYYSSNREEGYGGLDLYGFDLHEAVQAIPTGLAKGKVIDAETREPLLADFELIALETAKSIAKSRTDKVSGEFFIPLPLNETIGVNVSAKGYLFYSDKFSLTQADVDEPKELLIELQPLKPGKKVVMNNVFFETAKFALKKESKGELKKVADYLKAYPQVKVEVSGHTDNVGNAENNRVLSENRAKSVYEYFLELGVDETQLSYKGYGATEPVESNDTEAGRAKNRRTELKILSI